MTATMIYINMDIMNIRTQIKFVQEDWDSKSKTTIVDKIISNSTRENPFGLTYTCRP